MLASTIRQASHSGSLGGEVLALELNVDFSAAGFTEGPGGLFGSLNLCGSGTRSTVCRSPRFSRPPTRRWATADAGRGSIRTRCAASSISSTSRLTIAIRTVSPSNT